MHYKSFAGNHETENLNSGHISAKITIFDLDLLTPLGNFVAITNYFDKSPVNTPL